MNKILKASTLKRISPSRFTALNSCLLQEASKSYGQDQLLPSSPSSYIGSISHNLLEMAGKGELNGLSQADVEAKWSNILNSEENKLKASILHQHLSPLRKYVLNYEVKKIQALAKISKMHRTARKKIKPKVKTIPFGLKAKPIKLI